MSQLPTTSQWLLYVYVYHFIDGEYVLRIRNTPNVITYGFTFRENSNIGSYIVEKHNWLIIAYQEMIVFSIWVWTPSLDWRLLLFTYEPLANKSFWNNQNLGRWCKCILPVEFWKTGATIASLSKIQQHYYCFAFRLLLKPSAPVGW